jgi:hypothetical protein
MESKKVIAKAQDGKIMAKTIYVIELLNFLLLFFSDDFPFIELSFIAVKVRYSLFLFEFQRR